MMGIMVVLMGYGLEEMNERERGGGGGGRRELYTSRVD